MCPSDALRRLLAHRLPSELRCTPVDLEHQLREQMSGEGPSVSSDSQGAAELATVDDQNLTCASRTWWKMTKEQRRVCLELLRQAEGDPAEFEDLMRAYDPRPL
jgi:hypothetical protein